LRINKYFSFQKYKFQILKRFKRFFSQIDFLKKKALEKSSVFFVVAIFMPENKVSKKIPSNIQKNFHQIKFLTSGKFFGHSSVSNFLFRHQFFTNIVLNGAIFI